MSALRVCPPAGAVLALMCLGFLWADQSKSQPVPLPPTLTKLNPMGPDDLRAIEKQVQAVVAKVMPAVVGVRIGPGQGSGVIISPDGYVLTAGHVSGNPGRELHVILPDGRTLKAKALGRNGSMDSGLIKITDKGPFPYVEMGKSSEVKRGQWVIAIGHPGGYRKNRPPVVRIGRVLAAGRSFLRTDCPLVGGDSGGPLFDMTGRVIGIHSRIGLTMNDNIDVPVDTYRQTWDRLARGESWGGMIGQLVYSPGGKTILEVEGKLSPDDPKDSRMQDSFQKTYLLRMVPGSVYTIEMFSPDAKQLDPYLRLEDSKHAELAEDDDGAGKHDARIVFRPLHEDEYRIIATTYGPHQAGPYRLVVRRLDLYEQSVSGKVDVLRKLDLPKPHAPIYFERFKQLGLQPELRVTLFDAKGALAVGQDVSFHWAKGNKTLKTDANGVVQLALGKDTARKLFVDVPAGYKAAFEVTDSSGNPLPFSPGAGFGKEKVKSAGGKLVLQAEGRLTESDPFDTARKQCRRQVLLFRMTPGFTYTLDLESEEFDAYLRLEDSTGRQLAEDDDSAGRLNSRIVFRPTTDDVYRLIVTTCDPGQEGTYRLTIHQAQDQGQTPAPGRSQDRAPPDQNVPPPPERSNNQNNR
jgi:hypothetical protein